jgi:beta-lactamase class A
MVISKILPIFPVVLSAFLAVTAVQAAPISDPRRMNPTEFRDLPQVSDQISKSILEQFKAKNLKADQLAFTFLDMTDPAHGLQVNFRSQEGIYPASVVKLFYLAMLHQQLEDGQLKDSPELRRATRDMIVDSTNDATNMILDTITDTGSGPELAEEPFKQWSFKRNAVNRYFQKLGYTGINVNQKTWNEGPYGVERQFLGPNFINRNKLTTQATARLLREIMTDQIVTPARCEEMRTLLKRNPTAKAGEPGGDGQAINYTGLAIRDIPGAQLWSKAGWTATARHDAAYVELPVSPERSQGARFIVVVYTTGQANQFEIIPAIVTSFLKLDWPRLRAGAES